MNNEIAEALSFLEAIESQVQRQSGGDVEDRYASFTPLPGQLKVLQHPSVEIVVQGPNRGGKTYGLAYLVAAHLRGDYPDFIPMENRIMPGVVGRGRNIRWRIAGETYETIYQVIWPALLQFLPPDLLTKPRMNSQGYMAGVVLKNDAEVQFMTYALDVKRWEGWYGHGCWMDEPPPEDRYIATMRGLMDLDGRMLLSMTPLMCPWVHKRFSEPLEKRRITEEKYTPTLIKLTLEDNIHIKQVRKDHWKDLLGEMGTDEEYQARFEGATMVEAGKVYKNFDTRKHFVQPFFLKKEDWSFYFCIDPHDKGAHFMLWLAVGRPGKNGVCPKVAFWEDFNRPMNINQTARMIKAYESELMAGVTNVPVSISRRIIDPNKGKTPNALTKRTLMDEFNLAGRREGITLAFMLPPDDILSGHSRVRAWLDGEVVPKEGANVPELRIFANCKRLSRAMSTYAYHPKTGRLIEEDKHGPDCLRDCAASNLRFSETVIATPKEDTWKPQGGKWDKNNPHSEDDDMWGILGGGDEEVNR